jgi:hypothetical protein
MCARSDLPKKLTKRSLHPSHVEDGREMCTLTKKAKGMTCEYIVVVLLFLHHCSDFIGSGSGKQKSIKKNCPKDKRFLSEMKLKGGGKNPSPDRTNRSRKKLYPRSVKYGRKLLSTVVATSQRTRLNNPIIPDAK